MTNEPKPNPRGVLLALATQCVEEFGFFAAENELCARIKADKTLVDYAVRVAAHHGVREASKHEREDILGGRDVAGKTEALSKKISPKRFIRVTEKWGKFFVWPLSSRKLLADATREDITTEAEMYEKQAVGHMRNSCFFRAVEKRLKPKQKVKQAFTEEQLWRLMLQASEKALKNKAA